MQNITDSDLLKYNLEGIIPGPEEGIEEFQTRALYCLNLKEQYAEGKENGPFPFENSSTAATLLEESFKLTKPLFGIAPTWIPLAFSNYSLTPWHGGCAWIFQAQKDSPNGAFLQLRQQFRDRQKYLGLYNRDELIAHELSHVARMQFEEPQFEELLAYRSSHTAWRRWLGPVVQSPWESGIFMLCILLIFMMDIYLQFTGQYETYELLSWLKLIPVSLFLIASARVWLRHRIFNSCLAKLKLIYGNNSDAVIFRLTDKEINLFAKMGADAIQEYAQQQIPRSLRWKVISLGYK